MRRIVGIIIFVLGGAVLGAGFVNPELGARAIGGFTMFVGAVIFGLSFIPQPKPAPDAPLPLSATDRITGIFYEPTRVFKNLRHHPRWLSAFLVMTLFGAIFQFAFVQRVTPERIASEGADKIIESGRLAGSQMSAEEFKSRRIEEARSPARKISAIPGYVGGMLIYVCFFAGLYLLGALVFGGSINFWQALSVAVYATLPPTVSSSLVSLIVLYLRAPEDTDALKGARGLARADLGVLFSPADHPYLFVIGSFISLFSLYGWWLTGLGLQNTSRQLAKSSAWMIVFILWLLALIGVLILSALFPNFVQ